MNCKWGKLLAAVMLLVGLVYTPCLAQSEADILEIMRGSSAAPSQSPAAAPSHPSNNDIPVSMPESVDTSEPWIDFAHPGCFSVQFPSQPTKETSIVQGIETLKWVSDSSDPVHLFELSMTSFAKGTLDMGEIDGFLFSAMNSRCKELGTQPSSKRRIQSQAFPGCMFKAVTSDAEWEFLIRVNGDTVYTLSVCSMPGEGNDGSAARFFKSFSFQ